MLRDAQATANKLGKPRFVYARYWEGVNAEYSEHWSYGSTDIEPHEWLKTHSTSTVRFLFRIDPDARLDVI